MEWSENVEDALEDPIRVELRKVDDDPEQRVISIEGGQRFADLSI